jgi:hypothetical protein
MRLGLSTLTSNKEKAPAGFLLLLLRPWPNCRCAGGTEGLILGLISARRRSSASDRRDRPSWSPSRHDPVLEMKLS